jgi:PKD repeat protein
VAGQARDAVGEAVERRTTAEPRCPVFSRRRSILGLAGAVLLVLCSSGPAGAHRANRGLRPGVRVPSWAAHRRVHFFPGVPRSSALSGLSEQGIQIEAHKNLNQRQGTDRPLRYREGRGVQHSPHVYVIFWGGAWNEATGSALRAQLLKMYQGLSGSSYEGILTQYFDQTGRVSQAVTVTDYTDAAVRAPAEVNDAKLQEEAASAIRANGWSGDFDAQFVVVPAPGSTYEAGFDKEFCGYHGVTSEGGYSYTFYPYIGDEPFYKECIGYDSSSADDVTSMTAAHEYAESATDPQLDTWFTEAGFEIADICATHVYEATEGALAGSSVAGLWDDHQSECSLSDPSPPFVYAVTEPGVSLSPHEVELVGVVNPESSETHYRFEYDTSEYYPHGAPHGTSVPVPDAGAGSARSDYQVSEVLSGLAEGTYHYRLVAINATGTVRGEDRKAILSRFTAGTLPQPADGSGSEDRVAYGVSCMSPQMCVSVGAYWSMSVHTFVTLAEQWNGVAWSVMATPNPPGATEGVFPNTYAELLGVSCSSATACTAVGYYKNGAGVEETLAERWDGSQWTIQPTPNPSGALTSTLKGVSCSSATACTAVGYYKNGAGVEGTLAESWDGSAWTIQPTPEPSGASGSRLKGVSCDSSTECVAVGHYKNASGSEVTLAERWDGSQWSVQSTPNPGGEQPSSALSGVSCTSSSACTAVGVHEYRLGGCCVWTTLAERWDGSEWTIQPTPEPLSVYDGTSYGSNLVGVSCTSSDACTAVGSYDSREPAAPGSQPLGERWDGTTWSLLSMAVLPEPADWWHESWLYAVSCVEAAACAAVGENLSAPPGGQSPSIAFAEHELTGTSPLASFSMGSASPIAGQPVSFDGSASSDPNGTISSYSWSFGDGGSATGATPSHTYAEPGRYTVTLTVTDEAGRTGSVSHALTVADAPPTASFSVDSASPMPGQPLSFDGSSSSDPDGTIASYSWSFGDGSSASGATPSHTYAKAGAYTVKLTVTDNAGLSASAEHTVTVADAPPAASFTVITSSPTAAAPVSFDGSTSSDPNGTISSYSWSFGDGATASGATTSHIYTKAGTYNVKLTVTDNAGLSASAEREVKVVEASPLASFVVSTPGLIAGQPVSFDGSASSDPGGTITGYSWDFGDGARASGATPTHTYAKAGSYTVTLTVTDTEGKNREVSHVVQVADVPPSAYFLVGTPSPTAGQPVGFDGSASSDPDGTISSYSWSFGDGGNASGATTSHTYAKAGTHTVKLTIIDDGARTSSVEHTIAVAEPSNTVRMVGVKRSRNGNVSLKLAVPGPGLLVIRPARASAGASARTRNDAKMLVKRASTAISRAGTVTLQIVPTPSGRTLLHRRRRLSVKLLITFTPTDGTPGSIERVLVLDAPHKSNTKLVWLARQALEDWVDVLRSTLLR